MTVPDAERVSMLLKIAALLAFHAAATLIGACLFVILLRCGAFAAIDVLFYRGVAVLVVSGFLLLPILWALVGRMPERLGMTRRDTVGGAVVAWSLLLAVFIVGPVTFDRSISIFILAQFELADTPLSQQALRNAFIRTYVDDWDQVGRRLREQETSGNLERTPQGWQLTARGRTLMEVARAVSHLLGDDPRFVGAHIAASNRGVGLSTQPMAKGEEDTGLRMLKQK
ncbi:MAG: hypothetical protein L0Y57_10525 [Beijerinckiaceae bacterium]|nr:hypothetical protein [Beijerinckiaceae bacterium]